jgi:hypothetical protein
MLRYKLFKWLSVGKIVITDEDVTIGGEVTIKPKTKKEGLNMAIGQLATGVIPPGIRMPHVEATQIVPDMTIKVTNANGGFIVSVQHMSMSNDYVTPQYHIIPDDKDFDSELGKIITLTKLKS